MSDKKLLKQMYKYALSTTSKGNETLCVFIEDFYEYFNPDKNPEVNTKLSAQLGRLEQQGYIFITVYHEPQYYRLIEFSRLIYYEEKSNRDKILSSIIAVCSALAGSLLTFILHNCV